jgi:hypothetical protein
LDKHRRIHEATAYEIHQRIMEIDKGVANGSDDEGVGGSTMVRWQQSLKRLN